MISAKAFARQATEWNQIAPTLDRLARWCNVHQESLGTSVANFGGQKQNALIAESAFLLTAHVSRGFPVVNSPNFEAEARQFLRHLPGASASAGHLSFDELREVAGLHRVLSSFVRTLSTPVFSPLIPGCGVVDESHGDILSESHLVEVKAVTRGFQIGDLRQVLTYVAMRHASGQETKAITLLNPRRAIYVTIEMDSAAAAASGTASIVLLQDIIDRMTGLQVSG